MTCKTCGEPKCSCKNKDFTKAVIEIDNPEQITLMRKVVIPASMGDDTTVPPVVGKYKNVLLYYEANSKSYLYSSDGIPTQLNNGITDYEDAINLPQINGNTLVGDKTGEELGLQDKLTAGDGVTLDGNTISISDIEQYAHFFDTVADMKVATNLVAGDYAKTLGYHSKNDGGDGLYKIRAIVAGDVTDGGAIIEMDDNTLVAELIYQNEILPEQYGCYGDGTQDDTTCFKNLVAYITLKDLPLVGEGDYLLSEAITLGNIDIIMPLAKLSTNYGITINGPVNRTLNLPAIVSSITNANYAGITIFEGYTNQITVNYVKNFERGLLLTANAHGCVYNTINLGEINNCKQSVVLENVSNGWVNQNLFIGGRLLNTTEYQTLYGADIIKINLVGNSTHNVNNNTFINTCIEGNEGSSNGLKLKLVYATYNSFENVRFEGTSPKAYAANSDFNYIQGGYNVLGLTFTNDLIAYELPGITKHTARAGSAGSAYESIQVPGASYSVMDIKNASGQLNTQITTDGITFIAPNNQNKQMKINQNGINGYDTSQNMWTMMRSYGGHNLMCNNDGVTHCFCIGSSNNTTGACFMWVYDGHLYGKMGSKPSTSTDGTVIV